MDKDTHPVVLGIRSLADSEMVGQSIDESAVEMAMTRMDNHSGRLVDDQEIIIFIYDIQGNILRQDLEAVALIWHHETDDIARAYDDIGLSDLVIDADISALDGILHPMSRCILEMAGHIFVHPHRGLSGIDVEPEVLEHSVVLKIVEFHIISSLLSWPDRPRDKGSRRSP